MSKKCCGIIYSGKEKNCRVCGQKLKKLPDFDESLEENNIDIPLDDIPLDDIPLDDIPLDDMPLDDISLDDMPLDDMPLDDIPLDDVPIDDMPLDDIPLEDITLEQASEKADSYFDDNNDALDKKEATEEEKEYRNSEEVTELYGDSPADEPFLDPLAAKALDQVFSEDIEIRTNKKKKKKEVDKNVPQASKSLKFVGTISLILAILGIGIVCLFVYFMALNPYYDKTDKHFALNYGNIATGDAAETMQGELSMMPTPSDATASDAIATETDSAKEVEE